jgi:hypothetical protein
MNVVKEQVLSAITIETYMDAVTQQLPSSFKIVNRTNVQLTHHAAGQLLVEAEINNIQFKEVVYVVKVGSTMWAVTYATGKNEFDARLPDFEKSANTLKIQP